MVVSYNEDVEVGRCVSKMLNIQCTWSWEVRADRVSRLERCPD